MSRHRGGRRVRADPTTSSSTSSRFFDIEPVVELVERYRGVADTVRRAEEHVGRAVAAIAAFPESPSKEALLAAASYTVTRDR